MLVDNGEKYNTKRHGNQEQNSIEEYGHVSFLVSVKFWDL